jgi:hypothetical protein
VTSLGGPQSRPAWGEHEVPVIAPLSRPGEPLGTLPHAMCAKRLNGHRVDTERSLGRLGLGCGQAQLVVDHTERVAEVKPAVVEVDITPAQPERLAAAQPVVDRHDEYRSEALLGHVLGEGSDLFRVPDVKLSDDLILVFVVGSVLGSVARVATLIARRSPVRTASFRACIGPGGSSGRRSTRVVGPATAAVVQLGV